MAYEIRMPPLGQTSDELKVAAWLKGEGDEVKVGEPLLEVETDKATLEVEAVVAGTLLKIIHPEGVTVTAGTGIAWIGNAAELPEVQATLAAQGPPAGRARDDEDVVEEPVEPRPAVAASRLDAVPAARRLARESGIELSSIKGTGPGGRIVMSDVEEAVGSPRGAEGTVRPVPRSRRAIAARLQQSIREIPQFSVGATVNMARARSDLDINRADGLKGMTYTHLILRAVAHALRTHPVVNERWLDDGPQLATSSRTDVGLAVAGQNALLIVTIDEPDRAPLTELVKDVNAAVIQAREGMLASRGRAPTVTVSNLGMFDVDRFSAILDPAQTAILAVGRVLERPVVEEGEVHAALVADLTLTVDHRVVDGADAGRFMAAVRRSLEYGLS